MNNPDYQKRDQAPSQVGRFSSGPGRAGGALRLAEIIRLGRFFSALAIKQYLRPDLRVRPLVAELFLTENCNLRCVSCACWRTTTRDELTTAEWKLVIDQLAEMRLHQANFTGGEPLLRRDALELMAHATAAGIRHLHLNTNGILLGSDTLNKVLAAGVRSFNVSLDGPREIHDQVRGRVGAFDETCANLRRLIATREETQLKIRMNFTVMRDNIAVLPSVAALAQELGVQLYLNLATDRTFLFRDPQVTEETQVRQPDLAEALGQVETLARRDPRWLPGYRDLRYVQQHFADPLQAKLPCAESQLKLMIRSSGGIGGCWGLDPRHNVRDTPIRAIIDSPEYHAEHARMFRKQCCGCGSNYSLNLRWRPGTQIQNLLWRLKQHNPISKGTNQ